MRESRSAPTLRSRLWARTNRNNPIASNGYVVRWTASANDGNRVFSWGNLVRTSYVMPPLMKANCAMATRTQGARRAGRFFDTPTTIATVEPSPNEPQR